jgi:hypothetical protein
MTMLFPCPTSPGLHAPLECAVSRQIPGVVPPVARLPKPDETLSIGGSRSALVIESPFEPAVGEWRAYGRLVNAGWAPPRDERVELVISAWSETAAELRVVPHSTHFRRWGARRLRRWFRLAHEAADALAERLTSGPTFSLDSHVAGVATLRARTIEKEELTHGFHP